MSLTADFQKLSITGLVTLYQLDATSLGAGILYFHGHNSYEDWQQINASIGADTVPNGSMDIIFQGVTYKAISIDSEGLEMRGDGKASSPSLAISNNINGVQGSVSAYCLQFDDFAGAKLTVLNTLSKYLDADNFTNGNPTASAEYKKQVWFIEQKTSENAIQVAFELSNPIDFEGLRIPCREINNYCQWAVNGGYRGESCGYIGSRMYDINDNPTTDPTKDRCSGRLQGCKIRFGSENPLPFGGFPSSSLVNQ